MAKKKLKIYAFIDSQNLNLGTKKDIYNKKRKLIYKGWDLDFKKFRVFLADKYHVKRAIIFIGYIKEYRGLYNSLKQYGYELVYKPTIKDSTGKPKGNIDAELVLHTAAIEFKNYNKAVIVSGDGDFRCLHEYLYKNDKLSKIIIPNRKSMSSLLQEFKQYKVYLNDFRDLLKR